MNKSSIPANQSSELSAQKSEVVEVRASGHHYGVKHLLYEPAMFGQSQNILPWLSHHLGIPEERILFLIQIGAVYCNHKRIACNALLQSGDYIRVHTQPRRFPIDKSRSCPKVLWNNSEFSIVWKPSGVPVHPTVDNIRENVLSELNQQSQTHKYYITHRLDIATEGLILYAHSPLFQRQFNDLLKSGQVSKSYQAIVSVKEVPIPIGIQTHHMEQSPYAPKKILDTPTPESLDCLLEILSATQLTSKWQTLNINLLTGRTHQIRAQLSHMGWPIAGDTMYGGSPLEDCIKGTFTNTLNEERIALRSESLAFSLNNKTYKFAASELAANLISF